jgi:hypothetical protein
MIIHAQHTMNTLIDDCLKHVYESLPLIYKITFAIAYKRVYLLCPSSSRDVTEIIISKLSAAEVFLLTRGAILTGDALLDILFDTSYALWRDYILTYDETIGYFMAKYKRYRVFDRTKYSIYLVEHNILINIRYYTRLATLLLEDISYNKYSFLRIAYTNGILYAYDPIQLIKKSAKINTRSIDSYTIDQTKKYKSRGFTVDIYYE